MIYEPINLVFGRETSHRVISVFPNAARQIIRHPNIKNDSAAIGNQIYEEIFHSVSEVPSPRSG
ncbi:MAG: hypothetical protein QOH24_1149 [Verrucomicrobiota bacterium]|jgi:hypothetical protein